MASVEEVLGRVRTELGDTPEPFHTSIRGNGVQQDFDLKTRNVSPSSVHVFRVNEDRTLTTLTLTTDYTVDADNGTIHFVTAPGMDDVIGVDGSASGMFSDTELTDYVNAAVSLHSLDRTVTARYRDSHGFIKYDRQPMTIDTIPDGEIGLVSTFATIQALWDLATDASTDINVQTSEGTSIPRGQRHAQLLTHIDRLTNWYKELSLAVGVGIFAPSVSTLRRVSRQTGRLVPVFIDREYDEYRPPVRALPPISQQNADPDGPASPWWPGPSGY